MVMRRLVALVWFFAAIGTAMAQGEPVRLIETNGASIKLVHDAAERKTVRVPVMLTGEGEKAVFARVVSAKLDTTRRAAALYSACTLAPADGSGIWTIDLSTNEDAFADGVHELSVLIWTDADQRSTQPDCDGQPLVEAKPASVAPVTTCAPTSCQWQTFTITAEAEPKVIRKGNLLTLLNGTSRTLPFDSKGAPLEAKFNFASGEGVAAEKLWIYQAATTASDGSAEDGVFDACITKSKDSGTEVPQIKLKPSKASYKAATYSVTLDLVQASGPGTLCDTPGTTAPEYKPETCKQASERGTELKCQRITLALERKNAVLATPAKIRISITRVPFVEMISGLNVFGRSVGDWWPARHHPFKIRETGYVATADLSPTDREVRLSRDGNAKDIATVIFAETSDPDEQLGVIGPGQVMELKPVAYALPVGLGSYGTYSGSMKIQSAHTDAAEKSVDVELDVRLPQIALVLAIIGGIILGYYYRKRFETGLDRDREMIPTRQFMNRLTRIRQTARDADFLSKLEKIINDLQIAMHDPEATDVTIKAKREAAVSELKSAETTLAQAISTADAALAPWSSAMTPRFAEPGTVQEALKPIRAHIASLRADLGAEDAATVSGLFGVSRLPDLARQGLGHVQVWLDGHAIALKKAEDRWNPVLAGLSNDKQLQQAVIESQKKLALSPTPEASEVTAAMAALSEMLRSYETTMRRLLVQELGPFLSALDETARDAMIKRQEENKTNPDVEIIDVPSRKMMEILTTVQSMAAASSSDCPVAEFAGALAQLHAVTADVARALAELGRIGKIEPPSDDNAVARAHEAWEQGKLVVEPVSRRSRGAMSLVQTVRSGPQYRIVAPAVIYPGEAQLWALEVLDASVADPEDISWSLEPKDAGEQEVITSGSRVFFRIETEAKVSVDFTSDGQSMHLEEPAKPIETSQSSGLGPLRERIWKAVQRRTVVNGVLITIFGVFALDQFQTGYLALVLALAYGMAADVSADRLSAVLTKKPT